MDAQKLSQAGAALRAINSPAQQAAARANGKKGGRPVKYDVAISVWPPIGGARGQVEWRATWEIDGKHYDCYSTGEKEVKAKARRHIAKQMR